MCITPSTLTLFKREFFKPTSLSVVSLTVSCHGAHIRPIHDTLVLLSQSLYVALAEVQDLLLQHSAVLVAGSLLNGEVQQHHSPDEPKTDQEEPQLLGGQLPQEGCCHAGCAVGLLRLLNDDLTKKKRKRVVGNQEGSGGVAMVVQLPLF